MSDYPHLAESTRQVMQLPKEQRVEHILTDHWIDYPEAQKVIAELEQLMKHPASTSPSNLSLIGASGNGKTSIVRRFQQLHPPVVVDGDVGHYPVIIMQMPSKPSDGEFWGSLLGAFLVSCRPSDKVETRRRRAMAMLSSFGTRLLLIDEFHNLLLGSSLVRRQLLALIKNLSNDIKIPIVAVGTEEAEVALRSDPQLDRRFRVGLRLPLWKLDKDFVRMLAAFEQLLPLTFPSKLATRDMATAVHQLSGGTIANVGFILRRAAIAAVQSGQEYIDLPAIEMVAQTLRRDR